MLISPDMSDPEAVEELAEAMNHIKKAQEKVERDVARTELKNLEVSCQDCIDGIISDLASHDTC